MDKTTTIKFNVTPSQKETIDLRVLENGFDDISNYLKVVALKTQKFTLKAISGSAEKASIELAFKVTPSQQTKIEENMKASSCEDLNTYLQYVTLHAVVTSILEVRSTGALDSMLERIAKAKAKG